MKHKQRGCFHGTNCDNCYGCHLAVCSVCGCYEGSLTTECPGEKVSMDKQDEIYRNPGIDYTTEKGWHQTGNTSLFDREAIFEEESENATTSA